MRNAPIARPTYFYDPDFEGRGSIMQRSLDGADPITEARARHLQGSFRNTGRRLVMARPEVAEFVSVMFCDLFDALTALSNVKRRSIA